MSQMIPQFFKLNNGLPVVLIETDSFPSFTAQVLVGAGSRYENDKNNGIAHFFEHMVFKGTEKYPTALKIATMIESVGGVFNAFTDKDHTGYWIKAPTRHLEPMLDVIAEMVQRPLIPEEEIEREKGVIIEEMNMYEDMPARKVGDYFEEKLYEGTPLGYDIIGTKETVMAADRQTFLDYIDNRYIPKNAVLVLSGSFKSYGSSEQVRKLIEDKFNGWKGGNVPETTSIEEQVNGPQKHILNKKTEQAHFCVGFRTFPRGDDRRYAMSVLSAVLGGGMSSRLFTEVREKRGLCYYISTGRELYHDVGNIVTQAGVSIQAKKVQEALDVTLEQYRDLAEGKVTEDELQRSKEMIRGRIVLSLEDSHSLASFYGSRLLLEGETVDPQDVLEAIGAVDRDQVTAIAQEFFTAERLQFAMIGPFDKKDIELRYNR